MRGVANSGRNVEDVLSILEHRDAMRDDFVKAAGGMFAPSTVSEEEMRILKSITRRSTRISNRETESTRMNRPLLLALQPQRTAQR
jgi:hypothetical protein